MIGRFEEKVYLCTMNQSNALSSTTKAGIILLLHPLKWFGIVTAELKRVAALSQYMMVEGTVRKEWLQEGQENLRQIVSLCEELRPESFYTKYANKKVFRRMEDFWATTETVVRTHVKRMADTRLIEVVKLAEELDIPMLYAADETSPLHIDERLHLENKRDVTPLMNFQRHEGGTTYSLQLRMDGQIVDRLSEHRLIVIGHKPGIFVLDRGIYFMCDDFSGKLLLPFVQKDVVEIPQRMENDYFRRFILKHVTRAEINAEGFDIADINQPLQPCLSVETSIDGSWLLSLKFRYGNMEYTPDSKSNGRVTLTEEQDGFRFIRQLRNRQQECAMLEMLRQAAGCSARGEVRFASLSEMVEWLRENAPKLKAQGFVVVQPSDHIYYIGPLSVEQSDTWQGDWLQTDVTVVIDNGRLRIPFRDLRDTILRGEQDYMLPTGELLLIPKEWLQRYSDLLLIGMAKGQGFQRHRSQISSLTPNPYPDGEGSGLTPETTVDVTTPFSQREGLEVLPPLLGRGGGGEAVMLRPYQLTGFLWLWQNFEAQTGCCLSDEMGLGKTIQTIALLLKYKEAAQAPQPARQPLPGMLFSDEEMQGLPTPHSTLHLPPSSFHLPPSSLHPYHSSLVVAPTSVVQNWRNELARFAPSLKVLNYTGDAARRQARRRTMMQWDVVLTTYRTLLNDIDYLARKKFGIIVFDESQVFKTYTSQIHQAVVRLDGLHRMALSGTPVENNLSELWSLMNVLNPNLLGDIQSFQKSFIGPIARQMEDGRRELLRRLIAPYFLKRTKEEVLSDLPERQDEVVVCTMTDEQASRYAEELSKARNEWLDPSPRGNGQRDMAGGQRSIVMMAALQRLRQIANGEGKMSVVFEYLENLRQTSHKVLIFSEYVSLLERVGSEMQSRGWQYDLLTGKTQQRELVIDHFQQSDESQFFLISLKAGGVGLNLTAADYVFILDPWWNQAAEEQAIARAHRIGQHRSVFVYRFVSAGTLEEQILTLQERKQSLIDSVMPFICA